MSAENGDGRPDERKQHETKHDEHGPSHITQALPEFGERRVRAMVVATHWDIDTGWVGVLQHGFARAGLVETARAQSAMVMPGTLHRNMPIHSET